MIAPASPRANPGRPDKTQAARAFTGIDLHVALQIERRRKARGMSRLALAQASGVTLQQIQKYESGVNRISAARLFHIAVALDCQPGDLFPQRIPQ